MLRQGFSDNTIKAFQADLRLFRSPCRQNKAVGQDRPVGPRRVHDLAERRARRAVQPQVLRPPADHAQGLLWLAARGARCSNTIPAAPLVHVHPTTPLPEILYDSQINDLLRVTRDLLWAPKPDARPYLLVTLLLQTGIKKGECMEIKLEHIDLSNPQRARALRPLRRPAQDAQGAPAGARAQLHAGLPAVPAGVPAEGALVRVHGRGTWSTCWRRPQRWRRCRAGCSFEQLRWTCAVRDYRNGMPADQLRQKLGLSMITWRETLPKIQKLARPAL